MKVLNLNSSLFDNASHFGEHITEAVHRASSAVAEQITKAQNLLPSSLRASPHSVDRLFGTALFTAGVAAGVFAVRSFLPILRNGSALTLARSLLKAVSEAPSLLGSLKNSRAPLLAGLAVFAGCSGGVAVATGEDEWDGSVPSPNTNNTIITQSAVSPDAINPRVVHIREGMLPTVLIADAGRSVSEDASTPRDCSLPEAVQQVRVEQAPNPDAGELCRVRVSFDRPTTPGRVQVSRFESPCAGTAEYPTAPTGSAIYPSYLSIGEDANSVWDGLNLVPNGPNAGWYCYCVTPALPELCSSTADAAVAGACRAIRFTDCDTDSSAGSR